MIVLPSVSSDSQAGNSQISPEPNRDEALRPRERRLVGYGFATIGPIFSAGAQFLLSFQLVHTISLEAFGTFSFLLLTSQLTLGVSGAMLCAPYPVLLREHAGDPEKITATLFTANLFLSIGAGLVLGLTALPLVSSTWVAVVFGCYASAMVLRWFGRAHAYAQGRGPIVALSDITYGLTLLAGMVTMQVIGDVTVLAAFLALLVSAIVGLATFGWRYLEPQFTQLSLRALPAYVQVWRDYSRWSLLGVVTTEGTANAHAYIVTLLSGAAAFAPIAATALLIRPVSLAMNALTDFERPRMARTLSDGPTGNVLGNIRFFRAVLSLVWILSALSATVLLVWQPRLLFPAQYGLDSISIGAALWLIIALIRTLRMPESVLLQASGQFRILAFASIASCLVSVVIVGVMVGCGLLVWSLVGIAVGELIFAIGVHRRARKSLHRR